MGAAMSRRAFLAALAAYGLCLPLARAQRQGKVWRVGFLAGRRIGSIHSDAVFRTFPQGMRELGYVEGRDLVIEVRFAENPERLHALAAELITLPVDLIVAAGATAVRAAQKATRTVPIVMGTAGDPVGSGFVNSLARPGGNITGLSDVASDMGSKLLDVLLSAVPGLSHVAVLANPGNPSHATFLKSIHEGARASGARILALEARSEQEIEAAFSTMAKERVRGVIALPDPVFNARQGRIADLAAKHRLPCISGFRQYVYAGGLMNYGPDLAHNFQRAASYVDKIFKGARPGDLPVEQSTRFELSVNLKAANALGLTFPVALLVRANEVVQ
jgi:putative tryptophan/tyrosine transport system substrate-binding protein